MRLSAFSISNGMKIVLASPLYPPDIGEPAPYVKELAKRLKDKYSVTIVAYGHLPEKISGVKIISINKHYPLPLRLIFYTFALLGASLRADVIYAQNGASVELPLGIVSILTHKPIMVRIGDKLADKKAGSEKLFGRVREFAQKRAKIVINDGPKERPEILPLEKKPVEEIAAYEESWKTHLNKLNTLFENAGN